MRPDTKQFDDMSVLSDGTAGTSLSGRGSYFGDSREDLQDLKARLGPDFHDERIRVDRQKLENMISGEDQIHGPAEEFFRKVQEKTETVIIWPSRLKIGAKSKKDPYIRIVGLLSGVHHAKQSIIDVLDAKNERVTMKLDVSYTDHSHIIGRKGETIQRVMQETGCHIHFPDSNRTNSVEKSNQVSITGKMEDVERARQGIRLLTPLIFCFEPPIVGPFMPMSDTMNVEMMEIQQKYNVQVSFRTRPKLHATQVVVKGLESELDNVKKATLLLISQMCDNFASQVLVQMTMEIPSQHHRVVLGENRINLKVIMQKTGCKIMFPDAEDPNISVLKKSHIAISGTIHNVYCARQMLMGSLPVVIMFDLPYSVCVETDQVSLLMEALDVSINIKKKPKQTTFCAVIRGIERHTSNIYEARHQLLKLEGIAVRAMIPPSYDLNIDIEINHFPSIPNDYGFYPIPAPPSPMSPLLPSWGAASPFLPNSFSHLFPPQLMQLPPGFLPHYGLGYNNASSDYGSLSSHLLDKDQSAAFPYLSSTNSTTSSRSVSPRDHTPYGDGIANYQTDENTKNNLAACDYGEKKVKAAQARQQQPVAGELRLPTNVWAGCGLSQSTGSSLTNPFAGVPKSFWQNSAEQSFNVVECDTGSLATSNPVDITSSSTYKGISNNKVDDLATHLAIIGLEKYEDLFISHEIDLATFSTLNDFDLREIGVTAFGPRRKMLLSIAELKRRKTFNERLAPGAERKYMENKKKNLPEHGW